MRRETTKIIFGALILILILGIHFHSVVIGNKTFMSPIVRTYRSGHYHYSGSHWPVDRNKATVDPPASNLINLPNAYLENLYLKKFQLPLWNPYSGLGRPYNADMNSYSFYLPLYLFKIFPSLTMYDYFLLMRLFVAGFFLFLLLKLYKLPFWISLVGSSFYMFNSYFFVYIDMDHLNVTLFLSPMVYFLTKFLFSKDKRFLLGFILGSAGSFFGGNPNEYILVHLFVTLYFFFMVLFVKKDFNIKQKFKYLGVYAVSLSLGILLTSVKLIPFIEFWRNSVSSREGGNYGTKYYLGVKSFFSWILSPDKMTGGPNYIGYIILALVGFSFFNLFIRKWTIREKLVSFHFIALFLIISKITGSPFIHWIGKLPILKNIHYVKYCSLIYYLLAVLSSYSFVYLMERIKSKKTLSIKIIIFFFCLTLPHLILYRISKRSLFQMAEDGELMVYGFISFAAAGIVLLIIKNTFPNRVIISCLIGVMGLLAVFELRLNNDQNYQKKFRINDEVPYTQFLLKQEKPFRVMGLNWTFMADHNLVYPISTLKRLYPMWVKRSKIFLSELISNKFSMASVRGQIFDQNEVLSNPYFNLVNTKFIISESILNSIKINPQYAKSHNVKSLIKNPSMWFTQCGNLYYYTHKGWKQKSDSTIQIPVNLPYGDVYLKSTALAYNFEWRDRRDPQNRIIVEISVKKENDKKTLFRQKIDSQRKKYRDFFNISVNLSQYAGQRVNLNLRLINSRPMTKNDRIFFWGNLRIIYNRIKNRNSPQKNNLEIIPYEEVFAHHALVYKNHQAMNRGFLLYEMREVPNLEQALEIMKENPQVYKKTALVEGRPPSDIQLGKPGKSRIEFLEYQPNSMTIDLETTEDGVFVLSDAYYPGWKAFLDGEKVEIHPAFGALRSVFIPEGKHKLKFSYRPWSFYAGIALSLFSLVLLGCGYFTKFPII